MSKRLRKSLYIASGVLIAACLIWVVIYQMLASAPPFYSTALQREPVADSAWCDEFLTQMTALISDVSSPGEWQAKFTADQINGWLAVDLPRNFPSLLPPDARDPRVQLAPHEATFAVRVQRPGGSTVYSIRCDAYASDGALAIRILSARAGSLPMPLSRILRDIDQAAQVGQLPIAWRQTDGDPVAIITLKPAADSPGVRVELDTLEIRADEIVVSGRTLSAK